jgi:hypothetical protein
LTIDHLVNFEIASYRFRIGDYRVIFDVVDEKIIILTLGHRRKIIVKTELVKYKLTTCFIIRWLLVDNASLN